MALQQSNPHLLLPLSTSSTKNLQISLVTLKQKQPISKYSITNRPSSRKQNPICKLPNLDNTQNEKRRETKISAVSISESRAPNSSNYSIWWSDIMELSGRKWNALDIRRLGIIVLVHGLALFAPFHFTWGAVWVASVIAVATGMLGITLSFHRNLSHKSFKLPKWLEYFFAYCGALALQGDAMEWVSNHRYHHMYSDSEKDPHNPAEGFWFSHMNWIYDTGYIVRKCGGQTNVGDLEKQPYYKFMQRTYHLHSIALAALLYAFGGFPYLVWGMGVRTVYVYHVTWFVNSVCHKWGAQPWNTGDTSTNCWWVGVLAMGEGFHNNHHAFEYSARHGLEWWQIDTTWYTIKLLQVLGLATDVKLPIEAHKQRLAFNN